MTGGFYTVDIIHLDTGERFCKNVEACSHDDARAYASHILYEFRHTYDLWYGKVKISVKKSPLSICDYNELFNCVLDDL